MNVKVFKDKYEEYLGTLPSISKSTATYKTLINSVPFDYIDIVLGRWIVLSKNEEYIAAHRSTTIKKCSPKTYYIWKYYVDNIKPIIQRGGTFDYLQLVVDFINDGDILYALTIVDIVTELTELANRYKQEYDALMPNPISFPKNPTPKSKPKYFCDCRYALRLLRNWLQLENSFVQNVNPHSSLDPVRDAIRPELIYKIDGAIALAREIGVDNFIQYAIDQCYFFEPDIVKRRMSEICTCFLHHLYLYSRKSNSLFYDAADYLKHSNGKYGQIGDGISDVAFGKIIDTENLTKIVENLKEIAVNSKTKHRVFTDSDPQYKITSYPIIIDTDGNRELRNDIEDYTGYTVSEGKASIFQNYRISHIWGRAFDPRFFTNLWNVVLVPAWANDLLDKPNPDKGSLESMLKSTIMRICETLYFNPGCIDNTRWTKLGLSKPSIINDGKDAVRPKKKVEGIEPKEIIRAEDAPADVFPYFVNIIEDKVGKSVGNIVKYSVFI